MPYRSLRVQPAPTHPGISTAASAQFFFALGYLGWSVSPWVLFLTTAAVVIVT
jgi:hypothetical protein